MTHLEKIKTLESTIRFLYCKEGRSKSYIARLLEVDRKVLSIYINSLNLVKANVSYMTPSKQKFLNKNKQLIKSRLENDITIVDIAKELGVSRDFLSRLIHKDEQLKSVNMARVDRIHENEKNRINKIITESSREYMTDDDILEGEVWKPILDYDRYEVSNMGRVRKYAKKYKRYFLIKPTTNSKSGYVYVSISRNSKSKTLKLHRLVAFNFVEGFSDENNTVNHIDGNKVNNKAVNLEWVSQATNNKKAYDDLKRTANKAYSRNKKFKKLIVLQENNETYEFKTIRAFAKFYGVSETQGHRYISGETKFKYKIRFEY